MFNWFKKVEETKETIPEGVSEPVITFVRLFKENHRKFRIKESYHKDKYRWERTIYVLDTINSLEYHYLFSGYIGSYGSTTTVKECSWLSKEELDFLYNEISVFIYARVHKLSKIRDSKERNKYKAIYCKGE